MVEINKEELLTNIKHLFTHDESGKALRNLTAFGQSSLQPYLRFLYDTVALTPDEALPELLSSKLPVRILRSAAFVAEDMGHVSTTQKDYFTALADSLDPKTLTCVPEVEDARAYKEYNSNRGVGIQRWTRLPPEEGAYSKAFAEEAGKAVS
jgi:hypothetical protein